MFNLLCVLCWSKITACWLFSFNILISLTPVLSFFLCALQSILDCRQCAVDSSISALRYVTFFPTTFSFLLATICPPFLFLLSTIKLFCAFIFIHNLSAHFDDTCDTLKLESYCWGGGGVLLQQGIDWFCNVINMTLNFYDDSFRYIYHTNWQK